MISQRCFYALGAILELAARQGAGPVRVQEIAEQQGIPPTFLAAILCSLKRAGFVDSRRGARGGYLLSRPARSITVGQVVRTIDGGWPIEKRLGHQAGGNRLPTVELFAPIWRRAFQAFDQELERVDFEKLAKRWSERSRQHVLDYVI